MQTFILGFLACGLIVLVHIWFELRKILKKLNNGILTFSLPVSFLFKNSKGQEISSVQTQDNVPVVVSVSPVDAIGNPAPLAAGATVGFSVDNTAIGTTAPNPADPSGLSCIFTPNPAAGNLGTCNIQAAASDGSASASAPMTVVAGADVGFSFAQSAVPAAPAATATPAS